MTLQAVLFLAGAGSAFLIFAVVLASVDFYTRGARTQPSRGPASG
jgi:hypothetical protein